MNAREDHLIRAQEWPLLISEKATELKGELHIPALAKSLIIFCLGPLYKRSSFPYDFFSREFLRRQHATLFVDLLEDWEIHIEKKADNLDLLADRLLMIFEWLKNMKLTKDLPLALFSHGTGLFPTLLGASLSKTPLNSVVAMIEQNQSRIEMMALPFKEKTEVPTLLLLEKEAPRYIDDLMNHLLGPKDLVFLREEFSSARASQRACEIALEWFENTCWQKSA